MDSDLKTDDIFIQPQGGENGIKVIGDGAVELYHDNAKKFETTNTGAVVTGILTATHSKEMVLNLMVLVVT